MMDLFLHINVKDGSGKWDNYLRGYDLWKLLADALKEVISLTAYGTGPCVLVVYSDQPSGARHTHNNFITIFLF